MVEWKGGEIMFEGFLGLLLIIFSLYWIFKFEFKNFHVRGKFELFCLVKELERRGIELKDVDKYLHTKFEQSKSKSAKEVLDAIEGKTKEDLKK